MKSFTNLRLYLPATIKILEFLRYSREESSAKTPIYNAMIITHTQVHHMAYSNAIASRSFNYNRTFFDCTHSQYRYLWLIDDRCTHQTAKGSYISQRKCATCRIIYF